MNDLEQAPNCATTNTSKQNYFFQFLAAITVSIYGFNNGAAFAWASPSLPILLDKDSPIPTTPNEGSWIVSMLFFGQLFSPLVGAYIMDRFGRKITLLSGAIPSVISWILIMYADSVVTLYIARFFAGFSIGMVYLNVMPMYLCEIASAEIRGVIGLIYIILVKIGVLYVYTVGPLVPFKQMPWFCLAPVLLFIVVFMWMPESPHYLMGKQDVTGAVKSLSRLKGQSDVSDELNLIVESIKISKQNNASVKDIFNSRANKKSFIIALTLSVSQLTCGAQIVVSYSVTVFSQIDNSLLSPGETNIIFGVILLLAAITASFIIDRFGRRPLLLFSAGILTVSNILIATYFQLKYQNVDVSSLAWLPTTTLMIYIMGYGIGLATVSFIIPGEIFPKNIKGVVVGVIAFLSSALSIGFSKGFQFVSDTYGYNYSFWIFSFFSFILVPFIWILVPETKGKSLAQILVELNAENKRKV